jgi:hypothetical protein
MSSAVPSPAPSVTTHNFTSVFFHSLLHGVWIAATASPLTGVVAVLVVVTAVAGFARQVIHSGHARDPVRRFSRTDKALILAHAGGRCEYHSLFGRCRETDRLEADHVHPWSRGGQTALQNGQALCRRHNKEKRAVVPYGWQLRALQKRRAGYFPPAVSGVVIRHAIRPTRTTAPRSRSKAHGR